MNGPLAQVPLVKGRVGLFVTCLVDLFRPTVGFATLKLLEDAGCTVVVPPDQSCCGQPAYNSGDRRLAQEIARGVIAAFEAADVTHIVVPSGSCGGMLAKHYPDLFETTDPFYDRAQAFAAKVKELTAFLVDDLGRTDVGAALSAHVTYHDSCSCRREMKVVDQPRALLGNVEGLRLTEVPEAEACCGFGGTFAVKYGDISDAMVTDKTKNIALTQADMVLAADLGCLMNIAGKLRRQGKQIEARHIAEVLAGMTGDVPPLAGTPTTEELEDLRQHGGLS